MKKFFVSGLINTETTVKVRQFPIEYYPIDYPFFGVNTRVSGVAFNIAKALTALGDKVKIATMTGNDFESEYIHEVLKQNNIGTTHIKKCLKQTPTSVVLFDETGRRQIYCDLKDIQETSFPYNGEMIEDCDIVVACNINFNRQLLKEAKQRGKLIATDVHVLGDIQDEYNKDFMSMANILFLSDEGIEGDYHDFVKVLAQTYGNDIIVLGMGKRGALMYVKAEEAFTELPAHKTDSVVNTVGAGDSLFSSFLHFYAKGLSPRECLEKAQAFAAYKIGFDGASEGFATEKELEQWMEEI